MYNDTLTRDPSELPQITAAQRANLTSSGGNVQVAVFDTSGPRPLWYRMTLAELLTNLLGGVTSVSPTVGSGYATGAGGAVTQATNKSTGVTLSKVCGQITMNNAALAAGTIVSFVVTNTAVAATDIINLNHVSGGTPGSYTLNARAAAGSFTVDVRNNTAGSLGEALVIGFEVRKAVIA